MQHQTSIILAGIIATAWIIPMAAIGDQNGAKARTQAEVPAVFPTQSRDVPSYLQYDHIHTTPDAPVARFEDLDLDDDERLQWGEMDSLGMEQETFRQIDVDGSGDLNEEEYVAVSPAPENDYVDAGLVEPQS